MDSQRKLLARSDRVKSVDLHPTEPHFICGLSGVSIVIQALLASKFGRGASLKGIRLARKSQGKMSLRTLLMEYSNGQVKIWNYETQVDLKTFEVTDVPVRCVRYIARKNWVGRGTR